MDKYRIDGHKLMYHVPRVNGWLEGKIIYPVYMEISPSGQCNHRCTFCALDFMEYQKRFLSTAPLLERLAEMGRCGLKSIMYGGEGEPLLHPDIVEIINHTGKSGIDVALTTNAVLLKEELAVQILEDMEWIKVSIGGATPGTYSRVHRTKPSDFDDVIKNLAGAVRIKRTNGYRCTMGMQMLLLPENEHEMLLLAETARDIGMDYLVIKPYSQHPLSKTKRYENIKYSEYTKVSEKLEALNTEDFNVIFRMHAMEKWDQGGRRYNRCLALPFWSYIDSGGNVWGCSAYLGDERFLYGNKYEETFR